MKKSDLYREWARVLDMCEGTGVDPLICWTSRNIQHNKEPLFLESPELYKFAVAILEDKPVFVGDTLYRKRSGNAQTICVGNMELVDWSEYTWNPPKKTLPCPQKDYSAFNLDLNSWGPHGRKNGKRYYFGSESDLDTALDALHKLLQDATK